MLASIELLRPKQWIKNTAVLAGPAFAQRLEPLALYRTAVVFIVFCLISSAVYAINDVLDRKADAHHPIKKNRPLARGAMTPPAALIQSILLIIAAFTISSLWLTPICTAVVIGYFVMMMLYSFALKRRMILDVIIIAVGFVLRAVAGAEAVDAFVSPWLIVCTFTLCLFLGFGKRRCELNAFGTVEEAGAHRQTLLRYTPELLNHLISVSAGIAIMTFLLYTMDRGGVAPPFPKQHLLYSIPLVVYGVFRYAMLILAGRRHGPTDIILHDRPFQGTIIVWTLFAAAVMTEKYWVNDQNWVGRMLNRTTEQMSPSSEPRP